jgi:rhodanese-related sulfurtransferase
MRITKICLAVCSLLLTMSGAAAHQAEDTSSPKLRIAWDDFKKLYDTNEVVVVDVRSTEAYEQGHIPASRSIPLERVDQHVDELKSLKQPIVVYCA